MNYTLHQIVRYPSRRQEVEGEIVAIRIINELADDGVSVSYSFTLRLNDGIGTIVGDAALSTLARYNPQDAAA